MTILDIIEKKKNKQTLTEEEIIFFINGYTKTKEITDYQASAFLMAMFINGFNSKETYFLTKAMLHSGIVVDLSNIKGTKIDKHSTGGVGDKVSLILAPICAALGIKVPKMSGKGLGHTGGTIDKLESIGVKCELDKKEYLTLLKQNGLFIVSQTDDIVPADKLIYKLRNATATVDCVPLMASSIVSKKLALKTDYVFLDVKVGDGGFNKTLDDAIKLSKVMLNIFKQFKRKAIIHITDMSQPLGRAIGNAIEVKESIDFLNGKFNSLDLKTLIFDFVVDILLETKKAKSKQEAINLITQIIESKKAIKCFLDWVKSQHADMNSIETGKYFNPKYSYQIKATKHGFIQYISTKAVGMVAFNLGAGRVTKESNIDYHAGIYLNKVTNEFAKKGDTIATLYSSKPINKTIIEDFIKNTKFNLKKIKTRPIIAKVMK